MSNKMKVLAINDNNNINAKFERIININVFKNAVYNRIEDKVKDLLIKVKYKGTNIFAGAE